MSDVPKPTEDEGLDETKAPLMDHLIELRRRLIWCVVTLVVSFAGAMTFARPIFAWLVQPLLQADQQTLIFTNVFEAFFSQIKVAFFTAIMISFPIVAIQIWQFVAPGLYARERRAFRPFLIVTPILFGAGAALAYYVALPVALHFLLGFEGDLGGVNQQALPGVGNYLDFVTRFMFGFGVAFLLPVLLMLMERAGLVTRQQLKRGRRYAILIAFVLAAILTPPDVLSQFLLAIPLILLYEVSLVAIWLTERRRTAKAAAAADRAA